ncbi:MAG: hypothetical protein Q4E17_06675 [Synergistes sp.]|nr:hypothetical protein [Synergistes sp.]
MSKKRIFTWLTLAAAVLCLGAFSYAGAVKVGDTEKYKVDTWKSLLDVVSGAKAASGEVTIALSDDATTFVASNDASLDISEDKNITLDLGGKTLIMSGDTPRFEGHAVVISNDAGTLKITNGSMDVRSADAIHNYSDGKLTISGDVSIKVKSGDYFASGDKGGITINDGAKFYFENSADADKFVTDYLAVSHQKFGEGKNNWYTVETVNPKQEVGNATELKTVLENGYYTEVTLSDSYDKSAPLGDTVVAGNTKDLDLNSQELTVSGKITVPASTELTVYGGTVSKDGSVIFNVSGTLNLVGGKYYCTSGDYVSGDGEVKISEGTEFYFNDDAKKDEFIAKYLAVGVTLEAMDEGWYIVKALTPQDDTPKPVDPKVDEETRKELSKKGVVPVTANVFQSADSAVKAMKKGDFKASDLDTTEDGTVFVKPAVAAKAIGVNSPDKIVPFSVIYTEKHPDVKAGSTILVSFPVWGYQLGAVTASGDKLINDKPSAVKLYKLLGTAKAERVTYVGSLSDVVDKKFTIQNDNVSGDVPTKITPMGKYLVTISIKDKGDFDLDGDEDGAIVDPLFTNTSEDPASGGSSVGCNAGFAALALLGLAFVPTRRKK